MAPPRPGSSALGSIAVVGGGIVGAAVAREVTRRSPGTRVTLLEKEDRLAAHQTGHNSGVVHAGIYYAPGSLKARLCTRGRSLLREFCADRALPFRECGKLVVAHGDAQVARLDELERRARINGVPGLERLDGAGIREVEPHASGTVALHSPHTAITDFVAITRTYAADVLAAGGEVRLGTRVLGLRATAFGVDVTTTGGRDRFDHVIVCAGLDADRLGSRRTPRVLRRERVVPFRGEYLRVRPGKQELVRGMIYPVPDPRYPFLGVHFTRRVTGELDVGPNAVLGLSREGYGRGLTGRLHLGDVADLASWPGLWRMARAHWRTGLRELAGSLSATAYMRGASRYVPEITAADVGPGPVGVRAQAIDRDGSLVDDFRIDRDDQVTRLVNAPSPAATSSLAIAEHVAALIGL